VCAQRFQRERRREENDSGDREHEQEMHATEPWRAALEQHRVDPPDGDRGHDPCVAGMELEPGERRQLAAREDDQDAGDGDQHACKLPRRGALAVERPRRQHDEERPGAVDEHRVHRGGRLQAEVDQALEDRNAEERKQRQQAGVAADHVALGREAGEGERRQRDQRDQPAVEVERDRIERVAQRPAQDPVAGPEQVGSREQDEGAGAGPGQARDKRASGHPQRRAQYAKVPRTIEGCSRKSRASAASSGLTSLQPPAAIAASCMRAARSKNTAR